jgi:hypothetical protein
MRRLGVGAVSAVFGGAGCLSVATNVTWISNGGGSSLPQTKDALRQRRSSSVALVDR